MLESALWKQLGDAADFCAYCESWLALQCSLIVQANAGLVAAGDNVVGPPIALHPAGHNASHLVHAVTLAAEQKRGVAELDDSADGAAPGPRAILAFPIIVDGALRAVAAIELLGATEQQTRAAMRQLQWGVAGLRERLLIQTGTQAAPAPARSEIALELLAIALEQKRFRSACRALVTELATRFDCERVSIGFVKSGHSDVVAISHSAQFGHQMNLVRLVGLAMDEAIDQRALILHPPPPDEVNVTRAHGDLAFTCGAVTLLTIPLFVHDRFIGALTFERPLDNPFVPAAVSMLDGIGTIAAPVLDEKRENDRWLIVKARDALRDQIVSLFGPGHAMRKLLAAAALALLVLGYIWTSLYRITADATVEGQIQRAIVAPFNGFVLEADARAGDTVRAGQLLARLDDRDLVLERLKWVTERQRKVLEFEKAMGDRQRSEQKITATQIEQADAQIKLVDEQLSRARLTAPFDGLVISGDLTQSIGGSLQRGQEVFQIAPLDSYRVMLEVDESQIADIAIGQAGQLVVSSLPNDAFPLTVNKITPISKAHDGRNTFRVEARLTETPAALRPGMRGIAKIDVDRRRMVWIVARSFLDWMRLTAWRWFG